MLGVVNDAKKVVVMVNRSNQDHTMAMTFTGWSSEPGANKRVDHYRIDGSGYEKMSISHGDIEKGMSLMRHSANVLVMDQ
jgi:hypothetical protein